MKNPVITVKNLSHVYEAEPLTKAALLNVNLEIEQASCTAIVGVTGSGKTTLVQHFNGLLRPTSGSVRVAEIDVTANSQNLTSLRQRVGMLFQFPENQLFAPTVFADVAFGPTRLGLERHETRRRVKNVLEIVGLPASEFGQRSPFELSGGQRRRVALAGVLAMFPTILVLDEPTVGLDAEGRAEFYYYLKRVQNELGVTIVLVSHDMTEVARLSDQMFVLYQGQLVLAGSPRQIFGETTRLQEWGLAPPPLSQLLDLLRQQGLMVPPETFTLEEVVTALRKLYQK